MSTPAFGRAERLAVERAEQRQAAGCRRPRPRPVRPASTATGEKAEAGFAWKKPKPLASSPGIEIAQRDVVDQHHQPDVRARLVGVDAHRHVAGDHRDLGLEIDAPAFLGAGSGRGRRGTRPSRPDTSGGSVQKLSGISAPRALRTRRDMVHIGGAIGPLIARGRGEQAVFGSNGIVPFAPAFTRSEKTCRVGAMRIPVIQRRICSACVGDRPRGSG